ncbi:MAG: ribonuclease R [Pseudoflavonifractor sp.]
MSGTKEKPGTDAIIGTFQGSNRGYGFVSPQGGSSRSDDYFIPPRQTAGAWHGDKVSIFPDEMGPQDGDRRTARVTAILERSNKTVTGTVRKVGHEVWLQPDSDKLPGAIKIIGSAKGAHLGDKAAVAVTSYGSAKTSALGTLRESFGRSGSRTASTAAILYNYEIDPAFSPMVLDEADRAPQSVDPLALGDRLDLRDATIITIDGASAKDLDDAVSLTRNEKGQWVLGVHIADVSHYVTEKSQLDLEAFERGTSVYFADQVVPMLPVALSNGICSLNPHVDRLTLSCCMTMDESGKVLARSMHKSVIRSTERMTYEDCNALLSGSDPALAERYANILPMLQDMAALAKALEKRRKLRGSLDLDSSESYIVCDAQGAPVDICLRQQGQSEALIESFMLCANECVAQYLFEGQKPAVYRVHEKPSADKTSSLRGMLEIFGYALQEADNFTLQKILDDVRGKPEAPTVGTMVLRSLMKAKYDVQNLGHFGLAAEYYCHFTSPIRRYPDLMVHRILTKVLEDGSLAPAPWEKHMNVMAQRAAVQSSERELAAQSAEREIEKLYMAEFMQAHLGETFTGTISGVTKFGLFVMLSSGVEGLIPTEALADDRYECHEHRMTMVGERTGKVYSFGMALDIVCVAADPGCGQIDFRLAGDAASMAIAPRVKKIETPMAAPHGRAKSPIPGTRHSIHAPKKGKKRGKR